MRFVTDTHCLVWYFLNDARLSPSFKRLFDKQEKGGQVVVPTIVLAELIHLSRKNKTPLSFEQTLHFLQEETRFEIHPLSETIIEEMIPLTHLEIHDAVIVATALHLDVPLMTVDHEIIDSDLVQILY